MVIKRLPRVFPDRVEILLTKDQVAIVDPEDIELSMFNWTAQWTGTTWYAYRQPPSGKIYLHQAVAIRSGKVGQITDHKDGDGRNCRRSNLRPATNMTNARNTKTRSDNTSGRKGVSWDNRTGSWFVYINTDKQRTRLGHFDDLELAIFVREEAEHRFHGEFAR